jgi:PAS domain S-box-containing protein
LFSAAQRELADRRQAEQALRESERKHKFLVEHVPAAVFTAEVDEGAPWHYVSPQLQNLLDFSPEEWKADPTLWRRQLHPDDLELVIHRKKDPTPGTGEGRSREREYRLLRRSGQVIWVHEDAVLVWDTSLNKWVWHGVMLDITQRKEIEEKLHRANDELELRVADRTSALQSANNLLSALEQAAVALNKSLQFDEVLDRILEQCRKMIPCHGINLMMIQDNFAYIARRIGYEGYDELERDLSGFRYPLTWATLSHMKSTGRHIFLPRTAGHPQWYTTKATRWVESFVGVPLQSGDETIGFLNASHDQPDFFTQEHVEILQALANHASIAIQNARLHEELKTALKNEQTARTQLIQSERLALAGRLLASVSHELNNPLQAIQNALFLIKDEKGLSDQGRQDIEIILSETDRMAALIERLRLSYRPIHIEDYKLVQINDLIENVFVLTATHMRHRDVSFELHPDPNLPLIPAQADHMKQVLLNLFLNAVEAMPSGGNLTVNTKALPETNEIFFSIRDTGVGIDPEILPTIFHPFVTDKDTGTGLGLTITHDIIQQHGGRILAESPADGGARFSVWLPTHKKEQA